MAPAGTGRRNTSAVFAVLKSASTITLRALTSSEMRRSRRGGKILPEYLKTNVPDFVELKQIPSATELLGTKTAVLRAHVIAMTAKGNAHATYGSKNDR
jgi:hypothetical protein